jgi:glycosyltransferase involved in cell wall biosynthesis
MTESIKLPLVTVVIANYNYGQYVETAISSALKQDYPGELQVCIVDDGSTDGSWEKIVGVVGGKVETKAGLEVVEKTHKSGKKVIGIRQENGGASAARNTAINYTWEETHAFAILDADDEYYPNKVSRMVQKLIQDPMKVGVVYADYDIHDLGTGKVVREFKQPYNKEVLMGECIVHSNALINKLAFAATHESTGFYDVNLHGPASGEFIGCSEDYDLWIRISEQFLIVHIPESLAIANITGSNQTTNVTPEVFNENFQYILSKMHQRMNEQKQF